MTAFGWEPACGFELFLSVSLAVILGIFLFGGAKWICSAAEQLVPFAAAVYLFLCLGILFRYRNNLPAAFLRIIHGAFSPKAVTGGMIGSAFQALRIGCSRGVFTNEAGMGTASIAHASAKTDHPAQQGLMGIVEVFLDTIVICTITALVILVSGIDIPYGFDVGISLTNAAFSCVLGNWVGVVLSLSLCLFALATVLGWGLYGARCAQFLFGGNVWTAFALLQSLAVVAGAVMNTRTVWLLAETVNGLMTIPNLIALACLNREAARLTIDYKRKSGGTAASGGNYADFHQCKPL